MGRSNKKGPVPCRLVIYQQIRVRSNLYSMPYNGSLLHAEFHTIPNTVRVSPIYDYANKKIVWALKGPVQLIFSLKHLLNISLIFGKEIIYRFL